MTWEKSNLMDSFRMPLFLLGSTLIIVGGALLLYVAILVYQVLNNPADVPIVGFILERVRIGDLAFFGTFQDGDPSTQDIKFDLHWSESVRLVSFLFIGALIFSMFAGILNILISGGISILKAALERDKLIPARKE